MRVMYKKTGFVFCFACILGLFFFCNRISIYAEGVLRQDTDAVQEFMDEEIQKEHKKIISFVYDDSYSMSEEKSTKWAYANYALQMFVSMADDDDDVYLTQMSDYNKSKEIKKGKVNYQETAGAIREIFSNKGTQVTSVETAFNKLVEIENRDANTEYWLVVFVDGVMYNGNNENKVTKEALKELLYNYADAIMPNGTSLNVAYMAIGPEAVKLSGTDREQLHLFVADSEKDIIEQTKNVYEMICDRTNISDVPAVNYEVIEGNKIKITSDIYLKDISLFAQNTTVSVKMVEDEEGNQINISRNVYLQYPVQAGYHTDTGLNGNIGMIESEDGKSLPSGTYYITYDGEIDKDAIDIYLKPGFGINVNIYDKDSGNRIENINDIYDTDELEVSYEIYDNDSGEVISKEDLGETPQCRIATYVSGKLIQEGYQYLEELELPTNIINIQAKAMVKGFELKSVVNIMPEEYLYYKVELSEDNSDITMDLRDICNANGATYFKVYANNKALSRKEVKNLPYHVTTAGACAGIRFETKVCADGTIKAVPYYMTKNRILSFFIDWIPYYIYDMNKIPVVCSVYSEYEDCHIIGRADITVEQSPVWLCIIMWLKPWVIILLILGYLLKPRFITSYDMCLIELQDEGDSYYSGDSNWKFKSLTKKKGRNGIMRAGRSWIPWIPDRITMENVTVYAKGCFWDTSIKRCLRIKVNKDAWICTVFRTADTISTSDEVSLRKNSTRICMDDLEERTWKIPYNNAVLIECEDGKIYLCKFKKVRQ